MLYRFCTVLVVSLLVGLDAQEVWAIDQTSTGFFYPTGTNNLSSYAGWLASGCNSNQDYFKNLYHLGKDIKAARGTAVFAISDGEVAYISKNGWGQDNLGIVLKHTLNDGSQFLALYGHVRSTVKKGDKIRAGSKFATIGPYSPPHLHFGIHPGLTMPNTNWGRMPCTSWPDTNGFVDPIDWITSMVPRPSLRIDGQLTSRKNQLQTFRLTGLQFTPNSTAVRHIRGPNNFRADPTIAVDSNGKLSWSYKAQCTDTPGSYDIWVTDIAKGDSNHVTEIIVRNANCKSSSSLSVTTQNLETYITFFYAKDLAARDIQLSIFNLSGRLVYRTEWMSNDFAWQGHDMQDRPLRSGVYLYVITYRKDDGTIIKREVKKLVILR